MDVVTQPTPKTYSYGISITEEELQELAASIELLPENLVAVRRLLVEITQAG